MSDPIRRQLDLLLHGYGYNLYDKKNRARADDQVVRARAAEALGQAASALRELRGAYRRQFIPPPTREQPSPPPERLAALEEMARLQQRLADLETRVRGMAVPTSDRVWERFRREDRTLMELLVRDYNLINPCLELRDQTQALRPEGWTLEVAADLDQRAAALDRAVQERADFLLSLGG